ncbi:peptidase M15 [Paenibacillus sp. CAA11]|uniref:M15 family metallopeptidase n=1 Tax=Paenibacillus sp. CAA11 TaxID=1532905 RepID=UPI000D3334ED|nr:M15 family metallopeptidase [Paenibacillus sp. CAA11]AWB44874.1 peptidase M15 [Paenibacillus sp. CAA11]
MLTLDQLMGKSSAKLKGLHPAVLSAAQELIKRSYRQGINIIITQGYRSIAEQNALYEQGRSKPGNIVTNAKGGSSYHNFGVAIDFAILQSDGKSVSWTVNADWMKVVSMAKELGFEWGGDWRSFKDYPHLQITFDLTTAQYRARKKPTADQVRQVMEKLRELEEEEAMTPEEKKEFQALQAAVQEQARLIESFSQLSNRVKLVEEQLFTDVPEWAKEAVQSAVSAGLINTPNGGSLTFYRLLAVMHRAGLLDANSPS